MIWKTFGSWFLCFFVFFLDDINLPDMMKVWLSDESTRNRMLVEDPKESFEFNQGGADEDRYTN